MPEGKHILLALGVANVCSTQGGGGAGPAEERQQCSLRTSLKNTDNETFWDGRGGGRVELDEEELGRGGKDWA